jgi:hypothetical protein
VKSPRLVLAIAAALVAWSLLILVSGGIFLEWHGWRVSSRDPVRPFLLAALIFIIAVWRYGAETVRRSLAQLELAIDLDRAALPIVALLSLTTFVVGLWLGTGIAGGADSYGYVSQARLWANGNLIVEQPIAGQVSWPDADATFTPLAYKQWSGGQGIVPIYASGLSMLMALASLVHPAGVFWVVPLTGAALVALSFLLGRALGGTGAGLLAALLMPTSPAFLLQLFAPMSDVVVAAFWVGALVVAIPDRRDRWLGAGLVSSFAILTRPNTAPISAVFVLAALAGGGRGTNRSAINARILNALHYTAGTVPGVLTVAAIHTALYGSPFASGYGTAGDLYALGNLATNISRYTTSLVSSESPLIGLALVGPVLLWRIAEKRWLTSMTIGLAVATWLCYVFYRPFEEWWYLRFLLASFPCLLALAAVPLARALTAVAPGWRLLAATTLLAPVLIWRVSYALDHGVFKSQQLERRYADVGRFVADRLPPNAILYSMQQSGSLRFYANRITVRWDVLDPAWLDRSIEQLRGLGYAPFFVLEEPEEAEFRGRFATHTPLGRLNWPAIAELPTAPVVRIYAPAAVRP